MFRNVDHQREVNVSDLQCGKLETTLEKTPVESPLVKSFRSDINGTQVKSFRSEKTPTQFATIFKDFQMLAKMMSLYHHYLASAAEETLCSGQSAVVVRLETVRGYLVALTVVVAISVMLPGISDVSADVQLIGYLL